MCVCVCVCACWATVCMYVVEKASCVYTAILTKNETLHSNLGSCDDARNYTPNDL